ncbi:PLP-dependent transferase [Paucibacter sp. DJ1R-11]|uniref:PLP-dependent transferase n=1 Tax=Paucibacter sp. DJ1R-11 TaxID=2893556 RepID=UPI0021E5055E|nr:PLP-dependent transferase [Paucibacter sp. DJ1R-11]MCV2363601.1 PLP-dependent transferase [Paucibacter sp. DJ1R-11]
MSKHAPAPDLALATQQIHHPYQPPEGWAAHPVGVFKASTVLFKNTADLHQYRPRDGKSYRYGLHGTPTSYTLGARIAGLEGAEHCLLVPSGLAAVTLVSLSLLRPGDEVLVPDNVYGQNRYLSESLLPQFGIQHRFYDPLDVAGFSALINEKTKLVWLEAAGSITLEFPDLIGLLRVCRERGITTVLDNTWGAGVAFKAFDLLPDTEPGFGVDISMHALTKYPSGGADVLMGSVCTRDLALHERMNYMHEHLGYGLGQNDVELVLRSLPTLELRYRAQDATTRALAAWMQAQPAVAQVLHPALPGSPGHAHWREVSSAGAACLFSAVFQPQYSAAQVDAFVDALQFFGIGYSWAGPMSLAVPYNMSRSRSLGLPFREGHLVRFAIGLEAEADLRADLAQALDLLKT